MFFASLQLLLVPLCLWLKILLMSLAHEGHKSIQQTKIDGLSLSLCHQYRRYFETKNAFWNRKIELFQSMMSAQVAQCLVEALALSAATKGSAFAIRMRLCNLQLVPLELSGKKFIKTQEVSLTIFMTSLRLEAHRLIRLNQLEQGISSHMPQAPDSFVGLRRADLKSWHQSAEDLIAQFGSRRLWPRMWTADPDVFSSKFYIEIKKALSVDRFQPELNLSSDRTKLFQNSFCFLKETKEAYQYEVQR